MRFAILLDAGFLKRKPGTSINPMAAEQVVEFTKTIANRKELENSTLHRIYYYDAKPIFGKKPIPLTGRSDNLSYYDLSITPQYAANVKLLKDLRKEPFFAIRLGDVTFRGWAVKQ